MGQLALPTGVALPTGLPAILESREARAAVTVSVLSDEGFDCEGFDLPVPGSRVNLVVTLDPGGPSWSPAPSPGAWRRPGSESLSGRTVCARARVDAVGPAHGEPESSRHQHARVRFAQVAVDDLEAIRHHVAHEDFRSHHWRTKGGIPRPPLPSRSLLSL